jgi:hypothetical protein
VRSSAARTQPAPPDGRSGATEEHRDELGEFLRELRRRKVGRVLIAYVSAAFVILQMADLVLPLEADLWYGWILAITAVGFPLSLVLAWLFDVTSQGIRRTSGAGGHQVSAATRVLFPVIGLTASIVTAVALWAILSGRGP